MKLFFITNDIDRARFAVQCGVDRIFIDLEILGKVERQGHLNTVISRHTIEDVDRMRNELPMGTLMVRINPLNANSANEVNSVIAAGADVLMLPMFESASEVRNFVAMVDGRAKTSLLLETINSVLIHQDILAISGIDEVHIGLNDLHLQMGLDFMFEPLVNGFLDPVFQALRELSIPFGVGGIARAGAGLIPAELVLAEHVRVGSNAAILSRSFHQNLFDSEEFSTTSDFKSSNFYCELDKLKILYDDYRNYSNEDLYKLHIELTDKVSQLASK